MSTESIPAQEKTPDARNSEERAAPARILARSFYRELRKNGYSAKELLAVSNEMIDLVTRDLRSGHEH